MEEVMPSAYARAGKVICSEYSCHPESTSTPSFGMRCSSAGGRFWQSCTWEIFQHKIDPQGTKVGGTCTDLLQDLGLRFSVSCAPTMEEG